jgi:hypothetical protein
MLQYSINIWSFWFHYLSKTYSQKLFTRSTNQCCENHYIFWLSEESYYVVTQKSRLFRHFYTSQSMEIYELHRLGSLACSGWKLILEHSLNMESVLHRVSSLWSTSDGGDQLHALAALPTTRNLGNPQSQSGHDTRSRYKVLNTGSPKYKAGVLPTEHLIFSKKSQPELGKIQNYWLLSVISNVMIY